MVECKVNGDPFPSPQDRFKTILFEQCFVYKLNAQIYPLTPMGNKALQQYIALLEVIKLCGLYSEFEQIGGNI